MSQTSEESGQQWLKKMAGEKIGDDGGQAPETLTPEMVRELLFQLRAHQAELETQNEQLRRIHEELEASRARYFDFYNLAPVGYLTLNQEGIVEEANHTCASLLGVTESELVGRRLSSFVISEEQELYHFHCRKLIETQTAQSCELRMTRPDGSLFWAQLQGIHAHGMSDDSGYRVVMHDCTRRKLAEIELERAKEQWERTFDAIDDVITIHDRNMEIVRANRAAGALLGVEPGELMGRRCYQVFFQNDKPCTGCPEVLSRLTGTPYRSNIHVEHLNRTFVVTACPLSGSQEASDSICVARDISEPLRRDGLLKQMDRMEAVGILSGGIAHDFNNILFPILGYAELAEFRISPDDPLTATYLRKVIQGALRAKEMTSQILSFSGQVPARLYAFSPHLVVKEALSLLQVSLPAGIEIVTDIAADCGRIMADPARFYRVVMELCSNAIHAMRESGGVLRVSLGRICSGGQEGGVGASRFAPGACIDLAVSDTGVGMDPDVVGRVHDNTFAISEMGQQTGERLSELVALVRGCQGQIAVQSELGRGTTFHVYLPVVAEGEGVEAKKTPSPSLVPGTERILVVDDEVMITSLYEAILKKFGYQGVIFNSSVEALDFITRRPHDIDLMITDMSMPEMNGLDLSRRALAMRPDLPIILCTGYSELANEQTAREIGIGTFLMKPFILENLLFSIRQALDRKD